MGRGEPEHWPEGALVKEGEKEQRTETVWQDGLTVPQLLGGWGRRPDTDQGQPGAQSIPISKMSFKERKGVCEKSSMSFQRHKDEAVSSVWTFSQASPIPSRGLGFSTPGGCSPEAPMP